MTNWYKTKNNKVYKRLATDVSDSCLKSLGSSKYATLLAKKKKKKRVIMLWIYSPSILFHNYYLAEWISTIQLRESSEFANSPDKTLNHSILLWWINIPEPKIVFVPWGCWRTENIYPHISTLTALNMQGTAVFKFKCMGKRNSYRTSKQC